MTKLKVSVAGFGDTIRGIRTNLFADFEAEFMLTICERLLISLQLSSESDIIRRESQ